MRSLSGRGVVETTNSSNPSGPSRIPHDNPADLSGRAHEALVVRQSHGGTLPEKGVAGRSDVGERGSRPSLPAGSEAGQHMHV